MKRAILIATGTVGGLGAVLAITPPTFTSTENSMLALPGAVVDPAAAPSARISGLIGSPRESSGPLAKNAPTIASAAPIESITDRRSPLIKKA